MTWRINNVKILDLKQGSDEWKAVRQEHFTASDASAMMGASKYKTRNQLMREKKGWKEPISKSKQALFDKGHKTEEMAREILEINMLEEFPACVGSVEIDGIKYLASLDGFCENEKLIYEHKLWNGVLAQNVRNKILEPSHFWQLEHQCLVFGVANVLFVVSDGTNKNWVEMIYTSIPDRREKLIAGWKQFLIDYHDFEIEPVKEVVVAKVHDAFPIIECRVEGSVVVSNLGEYIPVIEKLAEEQMNTILETDQDFIDKDAFNKNVKEGRASLKSKAGGIGKTFESLAEFNGYVADADKILQKLQSHGEKQVKDSKETKKLSMKSKAKDIINKHLRELGETINGVQINNPFTDWDSIIKGKRSFEKMQDAIDAEIAAIKIDTNEAAKVIRKNLDSLSELASEHKFLFSDHALLLQKDNDDLINLIKMRIAEHEKSEEERLEKDRKRIQAEEKAKAEKLAEEKLEEGRELIRKQEREKLQTEANDRKELNQNNEGDPIGGDCPQEVAEHQEMAEQAHDSLTNDGAEFQPLAEVETDVDTGPVMRKIYASEFIADIDSFASFHNIGESAHVALIDIVQKHIK